MRVVPGHIAAASGHRTVRARRLSKNIPATGSVAARPRASSRRMHRLPLAEPGLAGERR
jgi:hypothetical protein